MGNRATIYIPAARKTIYLQWNGGPGSIDAFIKEGKKRANFTGKIEKDFIFYLHSAIRDYFNFAGSIDYRKRDILSLYVHNGQEICDCDNGHYILNSAGKISRETTKYCVDETAEYTKQSNVDIETFFTKLDILLLSAEL